MVWLQVRGDCMAGGEPADLERVSRGQPAPALEIRAGPSHMQDGRVRLYFQSRRGLKFLSLQKEEVEARTSPQT